MNEKRIYKYVVMPWTTTTMPRGAIVLSVGEQNEEIVCWAMVDPDAPKVERDISGFPTGGIAPPILGSAFIGTVQRRDGLVFHFFDFGEKVHGCRRL